MPSPSPLSDHRVPVPLRLSLLWTSLMCCFVYGDYFELYQPGKLDRIAEGRIGPFAVSQGALVGTTLLMIVPSLMIALSALLPSRASRAANLLFGTLYAAVMLLAIQGAWRFYVLIGVVEIGLCAAIVWSAWHWPRATGAPSSEVPGGSTAGEAA